jgi:hypothetical protein
MKKVFYILGVIDYLQEWNTRKNLERDIKRVIEIQTAQEVSV